jgi:purine-nucleoside phosphorylase
LTSAPEAGFLTLEDIDRAAQFIQSQSSLQPSIGLVLGSGLGPLAEAVRVDARIPASRIPGWPVPRVEGHRGEVLLGDLEGRPVVVLEGRPHYYEGHSISRLGLPVRVMRRLGARTLIVTNAAGAVNPAYAPGDLMLIVDHVNLIGMAGLSPLRGPNLDEFGPRFPDMSQAYDRGLMDLARAVAVQEHLGLHEGIYICLAGPAFETPADLRFLRSAGADAVGMSTVPEVVTARHSGMKVLGISGISNKANLQGETPTSHQEVLEAGTVLAPKLARLVQGVLRGLGPAA